MEKEYLGAGYSAGATGIAFDAKDLHTTQR